MMAVECSSLAASPEPSKMEEHARVFKRASNQQRRYLSYCDGQTIRY